ncbi:hypothetical protein [Sinimarinibacterium sp. CAU 1509]|uniref:hypothetical protein n=1 Tax=Sinimarinibacterium sp. CAU 1509 TaxID=2562283 RepID=UPI00146C99D1|nr:hypothetical protein [Sinimarinibacterium sp. CAU 1509]
MKRIWFVSAAWCFAFLAGCGGGGGGDDAICQSIVSSSGSGAVNSRSTGLTVDNEGLAFDGDLGSAAQMYSITGSGNAVFEATGRTANGGFAGVLLKLPAGQVTQVSVTALQDGNVAASGTAGTDSNNSQVCPGRCQRKDGFTFFGIPVSGAFDTIQASIQISGTTEDTLVYELCTQGS